MGGGASRKRQQQNIHNMREQKRALNNKGGVTLNAAAWNPEQDGPDPDKAEVVEVIACLTEYYKKHNAAKVKRVCGEVDEFIDNLGALFRSLRRTYGAMPRLGDSKPAAAAAEEKVGDPSTAAPAVDSAETKVTTTETKTDSNDGSRALGAVQQEMKVSDTTPSSAGAGGASGGAVSSGIGGKTTTTSDGVNGKVKKKKKKRRKSKTKASAGGEGGGGAAAAATNSNKNEAAACTTNDDDDDDVDEGEEDEEDEEDSEKRPGTGASASAASPPAAAAAAASKGIIRARTRRATIADPNSILSFSVRQPQTDIEQRLQLLRDLAAEITSYAVPEETSECKKSKTKAGDNITAWPDGTQFQKSASGTTVLVLPTQRVIQRSADKIIMKRPNGTLVQRSVGDVFESNGGYIINQKTIDGLQAQFNSDGFREDFDGGSYLQITQADKSAPVKDFLANPIGLGRIEEHTSQYHLVIDKVNGRAFETRSDGTQINSYAKEGLSIIVYRDGLEIQRSRDGHTMQRSPDGTVTQENPDGSIIEKMLDGSTVHYKVDGSVVEEVPGEFVRVTEEDGTIRMSHADETFSTKAERKNSNAGSPKASADELEGLKDSMFVVSTASSDSDLPQPTNETFSQTTNILQEVLSTERTYIAELEWVAQNFIQQIPTGLDKSTCMALAPAFDDILEESNQFLGSVNTSVEQYANKEGHFDTLRAVGEDFSKFLARFRSPYARNLQNFARASQLAESLTAKELPPATKSVLMKLSTKLILPVQRCMRYYMLLQQILKVSTLRASNTHPAVQQIIKAYKLAKDFAAFCNTEELQGQSQILLTIAPRLGKHIAGQKLMLQIDLCKASKNATPVCLYLYNNGVLVQRTESGEIKAFDVCAPTTAIQQNFRSSKKPPSLEIVAHSIYPKATTKANKRGWLLRESKRKMLSRDLQIRELEKLYDLMMQLVNNALLEANIKSLQIADEYRVGYERIIQFKKVCEEDLAHGLLSNKEYARLLRKIVGDCEKSLEKKGLQGHIEIPIVVIAKSKTFQLQTRGKKDLDLTANFDANLEAAKDAIRSGRLPIPVRGAYILDRGTGLFHHIIAAWTTGSTS